MNDNERQNAIVHFLKKLQETIIQAFESFESQHIFQKKSWNYASGKGGGEMAVLRGSVFEKAAVNWSGIHGENFPMADGNGPFFATGISLITHMANPHAPTVHFNIRYIETPTKFWFAGGYDLTPMGFAYKEDTEHFHGIAKNTLDKFDVSLYPQFSKNAQEYFYIPHRQRERGVGGIFFDHYNTGDLEADLNLWKAIGSRFLEAILPIYGRRTNTAYSPEQKEVQNCYRAHYVEFNLIYDRGTKFGFLSGGNPEAILCSMPPVAKW